jgi:hypothetical protein
LQAVVCGGIRKARNEFIDVSDALYSSQRSAIAIEETISDVLVVERALHIPRLVELLEIPGILVDLEVLPRE